MLSIAAAELSWSRDLFVGEEFFLALGGALGAKLALADFAAGGLLALANYFSAFGF